MASDEDDRRMQDGDHHPAVEAFISGHPGELPELGDPPGDERDPLLDGDRISIEADEE